MHDVHPRFWLDLASKIGPPIFAATLVGCLLRGDLAPLHLVLMAVGLLLIFISHWGIHHVKPRSDSSADG